MKTNISKTLKITIIALMTTLSLSSFKNVEFKPTTQNVGQAATLPIWLQKKIEREIKDSTSMVSVIRYANALTKELCYFSFTGKTIRSNQVVEGKETHTHCVGYSNVMTDICNYAFKTKNMQAIAYHVRGEIVIDGFEVCAHLGKKNSFFKDHDYVHIISKTRFECWADPSFEDLMDVDLMIIMNEND